MKKALVLSILVHAAILAGARPLTASLAPDARPEPAPLEPDRWTGTSIEVSTGDDALPGTPGHAAGTQPGAAATSQNTNADQGSSGAPAAPTGADGASPAAPGASTTAAATPATTTVTAAASARPSAQPPSRPPRSARPRRSKRGARASAAAASATAVGSSAAPSASSASSAAPGETSASPAASSDAAAGAGASGTFGSEGPASVRDLGRAFTRAIPAACSADPAWSTLAAGDAGALRVEIRVDSEGHIQSAQPVGESPPKHLVNVIRRTIPLLQAGTFAVRGGAPSAGIQTLELKATVGDDGSGDDGGSEARDRLAFSYEGGRGKASFTQTGGRRVDIQVRVVSVNVEE